MSTAVYEVSSEIYAETDFQPIQTENGRVISKFKYCYPTEGAAATLEADQDGDLIVQRRRKGIIKIEHQASTVLKLVGLQVWRGALLLADFIFHNRMKFENRKILELGAGVGLTSIAAGIYCKNVICTDIDLGGILDLIRGNIKRNKPLIEGCVEVMELDFKKSFSDKLDEALKDIEIIVAADVIYDDDLTNAFIEVLGKIFNKTYPKRKAVYIALEKRYVFTLADLDASAPCFEYFIGRAEKKPWTIRRIPIDFPQYFEYERCKELVLLEITPNK